MIIRPDIVKHVAGTKRNYMRDLMGLFAGLAMLILMTCPIRAQNGLAVQPVTSPTLSMFEIPITLNNVQTTGIHMQIGFDPSILRFYGVSKGMGLVDTAYVDSARIVISIADTTYLPSGNLISILAESIVDWDTTTSVHFQRADFYEIPVGGGETSQVNLTHGYVTLVSSAIADLNDDGVEDWDDVNRLLWFVTRYPLTMRPGMNPPWWLARANINDDTFGPNDEPLIDLLDVILLMRRL